MTGKHEPRWIGAWMVREHEWRNLVRGIHAANAKLIGRVTRITVVIATDQQHLHVRP